MKPLGKLRYKPQVSEVFHCSSIGIGADRYDVGERTSQVKLMISVHFYAEQIDLRDESINSKSLAAW